MSSLEIESIQTICHRPLQLENQIQIGESLVSDGHTADELIELAKKKLGTPDLPMPDQKVLRALTTARNQVLTQYGPCTDSHGARLYLELAYEAAVEPDSHAKLFTYINLANEIIDRATIDGRDTSGVDPVLTSAISSSLMPVTEAALLLFNKFGSDVSSAETALLSRAVTQVMSTETLLFNPSFSYALLPVLDKFMPR